MGNGNGNQLGPYACTLVIPPLPPLYMKVPIEWTLTFRHGFHDRGREKEGKDFKKEWKLGKMRNEDFGI